jgi:hypothetical protein
MVRLTGDRRPRSLFTVVGLTHDVDLRMQAHKRTKEHTRRLMIVRDDEAGATFRVAFLHFSSIIRRGADSLITTVARKSPVASSFAASTSTPKASTPKASGKPDMAEVKAPGATEVTPRRSPGAA